MVVTMVLDNEATKIIATKKRMWGTVVSIKGKKEGVLAKLIIQQWKTTKKQKGGVNDTN